MAEERTRSEQLFEQVKQENPSPARENPLRSRFSKILGDIRNLFNKPQGSDPRPQPGPKITQALLAGLFSAQKFDLKTVNQTLVAVLAGLIALTAYVIVRQPPDIASVTEAVSKIKYRDLEEKLIAPFKQLAFYLDQIKTRDIFNEYVEYVPPPPKPKPKPPPPPPPPPKVTIQEKAQNLTLMGISWGESPKVMIRDEGTQEVHFLEEKHKIENTELKVKSIKKDEVIITDGEDEMIME